MVHWEPGPVIEYDIGQADHVICLLFDRRLSDIKEILDWNRRLPTQIVEMKRDVWRSMNEYYCKPPSNLLEIDFDLVKRPPLTDTIN